MTYILIVAMILVFYMIYHIVCCHSEIEYHIGMSEFYKRCRDDKHDRHMESLDKIISLERELREARILNMLIDKNEKPANNQGFVASMEPAEEPIDKVVNCEFRTCGPIIPISAVPDLIKENVDG